MISLFENVRLDDRVFKLLLHDQVFLPQGLEGIQLTICDQLGQEDLSEGSRS